MKIKLFYQASQKNEFKLKYQEDKNASYNLQ